MDIHIILSLENELHVFVSSDFQNIKSDIFEHLWRDKILVSVADGIPSDRLLTVVKELTHFMISLGVFGL